MLSELIGCLRSRFVFVVGKGGVGKSTCAGAIALGLADRGRRVHLLSTDPAHSVGDLFGRELLTGAPARSPCSDRLVLEELDATRLSAHWMAGVRGAVAQLVDRGTYLDAADASELLDRSLPGMDEVMGAVRIVELDTDAASDVIVVDTAPTGHTLRMLDCGVVLDGWVAGMRAMADKAGAVSQALTGRRARVEGEAVMERLREDVARFRDTLGSDADFVVVTREGAVVEAETERLVGRLAKDGRRVAAVVDIGAATVAEAEAEPGGTEGRLRIPFADGLVGCDGLRRWGQAPTGSVGAGPTRPAKRAGRAPTPPGRLLTVGRVVFFVGKGGVGKSTCAAAYALSLAEERDVLLLGIDPAGSLGDVLARPVGAEPAPVTPRLTVAQLDSDARLGAFRARYRDRIRQVFTRLGLDRAAALDRRVLESLIEMAPPGIDEIFALDAILQSLDDDRVLVVDTAPTGHFLRLLGMPETALSWTRAVLATLLKYRAVVPLEEAATDLLAFARRLDELARRLRDPDFATAVVVTTGGALQHEETQRLSARLAEAGLPVAAVLLNRSDDPEPAAGAVTRVHAPRSVPPPVGTTALLDFARAWRSA